MKVYIAAPWDHRDEADIAAAKFEVEGHTITHKWWDFDVPDLNRTRMQRCAEQDYNAVIAADVFFLMNLQERGKETSGKAVETGVALVCSREWGTPRRLIAMGVRDTNVFQYLDDFTWVKSVEEAIGEIDSRRV